jgi:hypothetical protein
MFEVDAQQDKHSHSSEKQPIPIKRQLWRVLMRRRADGDPGYPFPSWKRNPASMLRDKGVVAFVRRIRLMSMLQLHYALWDSRFELLETVRTSGLLHKQDLAPEDASNLGQASEYAPSPRLVVQWLIDGLKEDLSRFTFMDFGSGRGRVLLAAAERPLQAVRGIEFSSQLHKEAALNISNYPKDRLVCTDVQSVCEDALVYPLPEGDSILYFYNPFGVDLMDKVVRQAVDTAQARNSRLFVIYYNPVHHRALSSETRLKPRPLSFFAQLKLTFFSPYPIRVYEMVSG